MSTLTSACEHKLAPWPVGVAGLISGGRLELNYQFCGYPATVLHIDALRLGPLTHLNGVQPVRRCLAAAADWPPCTAAGPAGCADVACHCITERLGMFGVQVNLVLGPVQAEADRAFCGAAVKVVDEQGLHSLRHGCS